LAGTVAASALSRARFFGCGESVTGSLLRPLPLLLLLLWPALAKLLLLLLLLLLLPSPPLPLQLKLRSSSTGAYDTSLLVLRLGRVQLYSCPGHE
jgi:hypothetical protein